MPFFSIVIPTYNRADLVGATLDSALAQDFADYEVIVVDDGSTDRTLEVLAAYGDRIKVFQQKNSGPGPARTLGASHASGKYLVMFDSDDLLFPWALGIYKRVIDEQNSPAFVVGRPLIFRKESELATASAGAIQAEAYENLFVALRDHSQSWRWWGNSSMVIRRDIFDSVGGYTTTRIVADDNDMALRLGTAPGFVHVKNPPTFAYRFHAGNVAVFSPRVIDGWRYIIPTEKSGGYPGGLAYRADREHLITVFTRPVSLQYLHCGEFKLAFELFGATLPWNIRLRRSRYLAAFFPIALKDWFVNLFRAKSPLP